MWISSGTMTLNSISLINGVNSINNNFGLIDANYDLALQKYVDLTTATIGDQVTYTIKYMNYGPASVDNVIIQDIFPDDVLMLDSTDPVYNTQDGNLYAWNIWTLWANQSGSIILTATVIDAISWGELVINTGIIGQGNLTGVLSFDGETNTGNNISNTSWDTQIYDLALTKTTSQDTSVSGQTITFTLTIFNQGSVDASWIQLIDYIPDWLILDDTDWNLSWSSAIYIVDGVLPAWSSTTVDITLKTTWLTGVITNRAEIIADNWEDIDSMTDTTNNTTIESPLDDEINNASNDEDDHDGVQITVFDEPVYRIHKTLLTPNARPGDLVTYRIDYEMIYQTPSVYFDIVIKDILSTWLIFSGFTQHYDARLASHPWSLPGAWETGMFDLWWSSVYYYTLWNGFITWWYNSGYVMVQAIVDSDLTCMSTITNRAGYSGPDGYEFDPANRWVQDETSYTIPCLSDVWVEKNPIAGTYVSGDYVSWYITYGNNGPDTASNVILTEHGGIGNTYISGHTYSIGILTAGQTGSLIVSGVVRGLGGDNVDNTISITTHTPEINTGNNKDRASITLWSIVIPPRPLNTIAWVIYRDINSNSGYNIWIDNPINNVVIWVYSGGILIVTGLTSSTGYYFFHDLPDGTYSLLYNNTTSYIPYSSNIGTINGIPMWSTSGVMSLINIRLAWWVNSISNNFGLVYTSTSSSSNGGAYIPVVLTSAIIVPAPQTISTPTHASADETITLDDFIAQIPKTQTPTETVSVESVKLMPRTGARSKR